jgi:hypothetical protein
MRRQRYYFLILPLLFLGWTSMADAQQVSVDFRQAANNHKPNPLGSVYWINSALQRQNAVYYEGMSVPQRVAFMNIRATSGNQHSLTFDHLTARSGKHAYDFLTSYNQALDAAQAIAAGPVLAQINECGAQMGPPATLQTVCNTVRGFGYSALVDIPDAMGSVNGRSVAQRIAAYETRFGNRTLRIFGNAPITSAVLVFNGYASGPNPYAEYTLQWTSASTTILIEMAAHLAMGTDVQNAGTGVGYGAGLGAGSISGASYHVRLSRLDGASLGNRDNQIMGAAIRTNIVCSATGPSTVCAGTQNMYSMVTTTAGTIHWSLSNNTSNASILGATSGSAVNVHAGNGQGGFVVNATASDGIQTVQCAVPVQINAPSVTVSATPIVCGGAMSTVTVTATGGTAPYTGTGTLSLPAGTHSISVSDANNCTTTTSVTITEPPLLTVNATAGSTSCTGGQATVIVTANGGTPPYIGTGSFPRTPGTHSFTVTDANGCTASTSVTVSSSSSLAATATAAPLSCNGGTTSVTVAATGGTPPYSGTGVFTRGAGSYSFTVTDANNCSATTTVKISAPAAISATATAAPLACGNGTTTVTVAATGGTPPYTGTGAFSRGAGTHTFTVTDANNCTGTATVTITAAPAISVAAIADPLLCGNGTTKVTVTATGGTAPYTGTGFFARGAGTHTFTVTDANNCSGTATVTITGPAAISVTATAPTLLCSSGTTPVTVAATGGTPPYSGTGVFPRSTGTHTFTVTDANNCTGTATITITAPASVVATASATRIDCSGGTSTVTIAATGGTPPYTGTGSFQRAAGTWNFTVTDAANCSATTSITITEPAQLTASATSTVIGCNGGSSSVTVSAAGGTPPYTGTGSFSRGAGTHTFTVTDANNCTAQVSVLITQPAAVSVTATATPIGCNGGTSTVTVAAAGGTPPYTGIGSFPRTAGTYTFTVTDANNCSGTASVTITEPASITVTATAPPLLCSSATTPVTVAAAGGVGPYTGTGTFMRSAGTHTFTVTDANNCTAQTTITITAPSSVSATATATPIDCNGGMSTVTVTAAGGTPPYTGTGVFSRGAGTHTFTVTDANNCSMQASVTITEPAALVAAATSTPIACNGGTSAVTVTATGGVGPYRGTGTFTRSAGTYSFTVTDANNCSSQVSVQIIEPAALVATSSATPIVCNGGPSTITVSATGGTPPYTGTGVFSRGAGIYTFTVTDVNNCQSQTSVNISEPSPVIAYATSTPIDCQGGTSTVTITAAGGTPPYTGIGTFTRGAGTYSFTVTDANNCSGQVSITITEPAALTVVVDATPIACNAGTSTITVTAAGGTPPYTGTGVFVRGAGYYTFTVTDSKNCSASMSIGITQPNPLVAVANATPILCNGGMSTVTVTATGGTLPYTGTGVFQRGAGIHTFTVIDANSCTTHVTITISEPSPVIAYATATPILCAGDLSTVTITAAGGTPPYSGVGQFSRPAGTHGFTVTDSKGCTGIVTITITEPPALVAVVNFTPILCNGDLSTVTITGAGGTPPYVGTGVVSRGAGTHTFTITDANGCTASRTITITQPPVLTALANAQPIQCNGELTVVTVTAAGGTAPYSGTGQYIRGAGTYSFTVTDFYGCRATVSITVTEPAPLVAASSGPNLLCGNDLSNINVTASGGTPPYSGTGVFPKHPGTYTFTVTDANGCKAYTTITIAGPPALVAAAAATDILCNGGNSTVTVTASGGTPPYSGTGVFPRRAGQHTFTVVDANGCRDSLTISISEPPPLVIACSVTPNCVNGMRTVSVNATGGTPPYTYIWMPGNSTGPTMTVPCTMSGRITVIVRDANWNPADPNNSSCEATCMINLDLFAPDDSSSTISRSMPNGGGEPTDAVLLENYPNPFNPSTTIRYTLPEASRVRLIVLNMLGQLQSVLVDAEVAAGSHVVPWSATDDEGRGLPTGRYLYRLHAVPLSGAPEIVRERLMLLVK